MAYVKETWEDRTVERPLTYTFQANGDGSTTLIPAEGSIITAGTPITAEKLNHIEDGIGDADTDIANIMGHFLGSTSPNRTVEYIKGYFFTNGGNTYASANMTFAYTYPNPPVIIPCNVPLVVPYGDVIYHPYVYNVTGSGFSCRINSVGNLGTINQPVNMELNFLVFGTPTTPIHL